MKTKKIRIKKKIPLSVTARKMIIAGHSNERIFNTLRLTHKLPVEKKWYVSWFRAECRRKGLLAPTDAASMLLPSNEVAA